MDSIKDIFIIGNGPSSSHTMGPSFACQYIYKKYKNIEKVKVILFGSLAWTGKGHLTDTIIQRFFDNHNIPCTIEFDYKTKPNHPNTLHFYVYADGKEMFEKIESTGGGTILTNDSVKKEKEDIYLESKLKDILEVCKEEDISLYKYIVTHEDDDLFDYMSNVLKTMDEAGKRGVETNGVLPGKLRVERKAHDLYIKGTYETNKFIKEQLLVMAFAYAVSEENASGGIVATAPTCGSAGVIPGVIEYLRLSHFNDDTIIESLIVGGLIGKIVKTNASVAGAVAGCQAEIGTASAMGAAMILHAFGFDNENIAQASEIALEHSLGLTCDPIQGYVQIPCIERNAIFALKAINSAALAMAIPTKSAKITFDDIVQTMYETGLDLQKGYRETSEKGMSKINISE